MHLIAFQNQHSACFKTEEGKQNSFDVLPFKLIVSELDKMQFNFQQFPHKPVSWLEKIDSRIF